MKKYSDIINLSSKLDSYRILNLDDKIGRGLDFADELGNPYEFKTRWRKSRPQGSEIHIKPFPIYYEGDKPKNIIFGDFGAFGDLDFEKTPEKDIQNTFYILPWEKINKMPLKPFKNWGGKSGYEVNLDYFPPVLQEEIPFEDIREYVKSNQDILNEQLISPHRLMKDLKIRR